MDYVLQIKRLTYSSKGQEMKSWKPDHPFQNLVHFSASSDDSNGRCWWGAGDWFLSPFQLGDGRYLLTQPLANVLITGHTSRQL